MAYKGSEAERECKRKYAREWYSRNREKCVARARAWNVANRGRVNERQRLWRRDSLVHKVLFRNAQQRARKFGIEFSISMDDIEVPEFCPILGLRFAIGDGCAKDCSPSLDRINPNIGYVRGNIQVISHKANTIKSNANLDELRAVVAYVERHLG